MNKKADLPGWSYVIALVIGIALLLLVIWLSNKSGQGIVETLKSIVS